MKDYSSILFPYAYNILGSSADAEDAVQDVLTNFHASPKDNIDNEKGYLVKSVINQSINIRKRRKKLQYGEVWLPEPVATERTDTNINMSEIVSYSLLILLERLSPKERAVFILKEGFAYTHEEIAAVLSVTVAHSRKLLSRAKTRLQQKTPSPQLQASPPAALAERAHRSRQRVQSSYAARETPAGRQNSSVKVLEKYIAAIRQRDTARLEQLLSGDIAFYADGGGKVNVVKELCTGSREVASLVVFVYEQLQTSFTITIAKVNHQPALLFRQGQELRSCQVFELAGDKILRIHTVVDPAKLKKL